MIDEKFVILGAAINFASTLTYVSATIKGNIRPNRVTWFLWALAPLLAFSAELKDDVGLLSLMTFMAGFMPLLIFVASFVNRRAYWEITRFDLCCGVLSLTGLVLWLITKHGFFAITFAILADFLAAIPTIIKSYRRPETESYIAFAGGGASAILAILSIDKWTYSSWGFPLYVLLMCSMLVLLIRFKLGKMLSSFGKAVT